ncbi:MAG: hypothetical protein ABSD96_04575 [Candidatus Korobacteraceae bacterium]
MTAEVRGQEALCLALKPLIASGVQPVGSCPRKFQHSGFAGRVIQFDGVKNPQNRRRVTRHTKADGIGRPFGGQPRTASIAEVALLQSRVIWLLSLVPGSRTATAESVTQGQALTPKPEIGIVTPLRNEIRATHSICLSENRAASTPQQRDNIKYRYSTDPPGERTIRGMHESYRPRFAPNNAARNPGAAGKLPSR